MKSSVIVIFAIGICASSISVSSFAAAPVSIFGLPVGGKLSSPIRKCATSELSGNTKSLCWSAKPMSLSDGGKSGYLEVPGADTRVKWAVSADFEGTFKKDGTLETLQVSTRSEQDFDEIVSSISSRFSQPMLSHSTRLKSAKWIRPDIFIQVSCGRGICLTRFLSIESYIDEKNRLMNAIKKDNARSTSP